MMKYEQGEGEALRVEGLCKNYRRFSLKDVSFTMERGYIMGLVGRNGAGKTTLISTLLGRVKKNSGKIRIGGLDVDREPEAARQKLGFVVDGNPFLERFTLLDNGRHFGKFYERFSEISYQYWMQRLDLRPGDHAGNLSRGEMVKLQLAFALAHEPSVLLLDEPTGNLDPVFRREFIGILQDAVARQEVAVLISTHLTGELDRVADHITYLETGSVLFSGSLDALNTEEGVGNTIEEWMCQMTKGASRGGKG